MVETEAIRAPNGFQQENTQTSAGSSEARALRTAILVVGYVLLIPGLVLLAVYGIGIAISLLDASDLPGRQWTYYSYLLVSLTGAAVIGFLLVRVARHRPVYSIGDLLYPALVIVGVYMMFMAIAGILQSTAYEWENWRTWHWTMALVALYELPYMVGGLLLAMIGTKRFSVHI